MTKIVIVIAALIWLLAGIAFLHAAVVLETVGQFKITGSTNNCVITVDADGTCDSGTAVVVDSSIAVCAVCAAN